MNFWIWFLIFWIIAVTAGAAGISAAPWVPTRKREKKLLERELKIESGNIIYDLGCGTGTILIALANKYPEAHFIGCEISALPYLIAKLRSIKYRNIEIRYKNLFKQPINDADFVISYLLTKAYKKLHKKLKAELKPEAQVIIEGWALDGIKPRKVLRADKALPFYVYQGSDFR